MKIINKYKKKQIIYLFIAFILFSVLLFTWEYNHVKSYRKAALNKELNDYSEMINTYISRNSLDRIDSFVQIIHGKNLRISIINLTGKVLYDNEISRNSVVENHYNRPEIQEALRNVVGSDIRVSATTKVKYYYFAKLFPNYFVRISVVYDVEAKQFIEPDKISLFFILLLFFIAASTLVFITDKFGQSVATLKKFTLQASENKVIDENLVFPENELGIIGQDIVAIYQNLINTKKELLVEKEKLIRHLNLLEVGIAIFSKDRKLITNNSPFIQHINQISTELIYFDDDFFSLNDFSTIFKFIDRYITDNQLEINNQPSYEIIIQKNNKIFTVKCIIFQDKSFEILINDTTKPAKRKLMKQQLTDNIAHELKTPVSSIKGFLETIINNQLEINKQTDFIKRAYSQTCRLTSLIEDISLLTKIEEAGNLYKIEKINLYQIINDVVEDLQLKINEHHIKIEVNIAHFLELNGNSVLLYSVFRNLLDNAIAYAGDNVSIKIDKYMEDSQHYYFSFSDNGKGVPELDLSRLFERFYRVDKGRDRKSGGTGLGLAIVKNTILFHKGEISVKNKKDGGLEFLFSISKNLEIQ